MMPRRSRVVAEAAPPALELLQISLTLKSVNIRISTDRRLILTSALHGAATPLVMNTAPARTEANSRWADLPHEVLVRIFAAQPEPLHNLGAEFACRAWAAAVCTQWVYPPRLAQCVTMPALRVCTC